MDTNMGSSASMLPVVQSALNTEQLAACAFQLAQLYVGLQVYCCAVEGPHKLVNASLPALKASNVRRYPLANVSDAQTNQVVDVSGQIFNPNIFRNVLARIVVSPCMTQNLQCGLAGGRLLDSSSGQ
jgi:hypothetical protein